MPKYYIPKVPTVGIYVRLICYTATIVIGKHNWLTHVVLIQKKKRSPFDDRPRWAENQDETRTMTSKTCATFLSILAFSFSPPLIPLFVAPTVSLRHPHQLQLQSEYSKLAKKLQPMPLGRNRYNSSNCSRQCLSTASLMSRIHAIRVKSSLCSSFLFRLLACTRCRCAMSCMYRSARLRLSYPTGTPILRCSLPISSGESPCPAPLCRQCHLDLYLLPSAIAVILFSPVLRVC